MRMSTRLNNNTRIRRSTTNNHKKNKKKKRRRRIQNSRSRRGKLVIQKNSQNHKTENNAEQVQRINDNMDNIIKNKITRTLFRNKERENVHNERQTDS